MEFKYNRVFLSMVNDTFDDSKNFIIEEGNRYIIRPLNEDQPISKGGNSNVFKLINIENNIERAIKISNYYRPRNKNESKKFGKKYNRFLSEIDALNDVKDKYDNIVQIDFDGVLELSEKEFPFYVMEKADIDLKEYLHNNTDLDIQERFRLCRDIFYALKNLHEENIYHRDIKPDNILLFLNNDTFKWKIGDLGLIKYRDIDYDDIGERIGPFGWISPEAMNKYLTEKTDLGFDCKIDLSSDIFMLGKLYWFIFNLNAPIGIINEKDFNYTFNLSSLFFDLIYQMLNYSKNLRAKQAEVEYYIEYIAKELFI